MSQRCLTSTELDGAEQTAALEAWKPPAEQPLVHSRASFVMLMALKPKTTAEPVRLEAPTKRPYMKQVKR